MPQRLWKTRVRRPFEVTGPPSAAARPSVGHLKCSRSGMRPSLTAGHGRPSPWPSGSVTLSGSCPKHLTDRRSVNKMILVIGLGFVSRRKRIDDMLSEVTSCRLRAHPVLRTGMARMLIQRTYWTRGASRLTRVNRRCGSSKWPPESDGAFAAAGGIYVSF